MIKEKGILNDCGLLGAAAFLSYTAAVDSPLAYSGYDWMAQAVSDLSASNAPSLRLWNQLSSLYAKGVDGIVDDQTIKSRGRTSYRRQLMHGMQNGGIACVLIAE